MRRGAERAVVVALAALAFGFACRGSAQSSDPLRAPRILDRPPGEAPQPTLPPTAEEAASSSAQLPTIGPVRRPPNAARLAPLPEQRNDEVEEIVVIGQGWRLPDLGSEWRSRQKEAANEGRFSATALPLYDPSEPPVHTEFFSSPEQRRHGYIELFRLRFGRRSPD